MMSPLIDFECPSLIVTATIAQQHFFYPRFVVFVLFIYLLIDVKLN